MNKFEIVKTSDKHICSIMYSVRMDSQPGLIKVISYPFENCQTFLIAPFNRLCFSTENCKNIMENIKELRNLCKISQRLCLMDVRLELFNLIKDYANIYSSMEYVNLTGHTMVTAIIKL